MRKRHPFLLSPSPPLHPTLSPHRFGGYCFGFFAIGRRRRSFSSAPFAKYIHESGPQLIISSEYLFRIETGASTSWSGFYTGCLGGGASARS